MAVPQKFRVSTRISLLYNGKRCKIKCMNDFETIERRGCKLCKLSFIFALALLVIILLLLPSYLKKGSIDDTVPVAVESDPQAPVLEERSTELPPDVLRDLFLDGQKIQEEEEDGRVGIGYDDPKDITE